MSDEVTIYSDGGADPNPGVGGWAALLRFAGREVELSGHDPRTTNNRMELQAVIAALQALHGPHRVEFHTDSQYVRRGITEGVARWAARGWKTAAGRPVANVDLWQQLVPLVARHVVTWHWVRGHSGDPANERVDRLARQARLAQTPTVERASDVPRLYLRASCAGNPGPGTWSAVLQAPDGGRQEFTGRAEATTNNRMEIMAAIEGLQRLPPGSQVQVHTTSDYLFQGITRWLPGWREAGWRKKDGQPVANADLWRQLSDVAARHRVEWVNNKGQGSREAKGRQAS